MNFELVRLFLRRTLSPKRCLLFVILVAGVVTVSTPADWVLRAVQDPEQARHAFARETIWTGVLWLWLPLLVLQATQIPARWRGAERDWLATRPRGRERVIASAYLGSWLGALLFVGVLGFSAEVGAGQSGRSEHVAPVWAHAGEVAGPPAGIVPKEGLRWSLELPAGNAAVRARIHLALAPGDGPFATARFLARRAGRESSVEQVLTSRTRLELDLPAGEGPVECTLERLGSGATLLIRVPQTELFEPARSVRDSSLHLVLRLVVALSAWIALAIGLGSWLGPGYAFALVVSIWTGFWLRAETPSWVPGGALPEVLANLHEGRVASAPSLTVWLGGLGCVVLGAGLAHARVLYERSRT